MEIALIIILLAVMEVSLSFDNAVVNSAVLRKMPPIWQRRFLTWGIIFATFGVRLILPVLIVAMAGHLALPDVLGMAINQPQEYAKHLQSSHVAIASFGGIFLLMVFLNFLFDGEKEVHWIPGIENGASVLGKVSSIGTSIALAVILLTPGIAIVPALIGLLSYVLIDGLMGLCDENSCVPTGLGFVSFIYLEVLDASFSLDGVLGAFAISDNIFVIMVGLGIGAAVIRSLTVWLVHGGVLNELIYLEHGAHWGIGALAIIMLLSTMFCIPELVTGLIGVSMIGLSLMSSIIHKKGSPDDSRRA